MSSDGNYRNAPFMFDLLHNTYNWTTKKPQKEGKPHYRLIEATIHGSMPPKTHPRPIIRVLPNIMIVMTTTGINMGKRATTCATSYNNILPYNFRGHSKSGPAIPNIINMFAALLGQEDAPLYTGTTYASPGELIGNRILQLSRADLISSYGVSASFSRMHHFGIHELNGFMFERSPHTSMIISKIIGVGGVIDLDLLQQYINLEYHPTPEAPIILYLNSCDVSPEEEPEPHSEYIRISQRNTHYSTTPSPTGLWPKPISVPIIHEEPGEAFKIPGASAFASKPVSALEVWDPRPGQRSPGQIWSGMEGSNTSSSAAASAAASSRMNEEEEEPPKRYWGGRLKKRKTYRKKRRWLRSTNRKRTGSKRASRSSNR